MAAAVWLGKLPQIVEVLWTLSQPTRFTKRSPLAFLDWIHQKALHCLPRHLAGNAVVMPVMIPSWLARGLLEPSMSLLRTGIISKRKFAGSSVLHSVQSRSNPGARPVQSRS
jgi:hypothetical protein